MRVFFALLCSLAFISSALAHDYKVGQIHVDHPWTKATPAGARVAGGYMKITNQGDQVEKLLSAQTDISERTEIHEMAVVNGQMTMREVAGGLVIKPGETLELKPGSFHMMFMGLKKNPAEGESFKGKLVFEKAGALEVEYKGEAMGQKPQGHHH
jgi:periplasmic copper chaperone A